MKKINRRLWFQIHGWMSLPVWVVFSFVCLTGTVSVISHELTWLSNANSRALNPDNLEARSAAEIIDIVQESHPTADISTVMLYEPYMVNAVIFSDTDKPAAIAYVNQYSGKIQEVNNGFTFIGFMRQLHGWLLFPWHHSYSIGYYLVSLMSIVMLGALVTGLVVYKKFWRAFFKPQLRFAKGKRIFLQDAHRFSGVWSMWFLLVIGLTGLWYLAQAVMWHANIEMEPHSPVINAMELPAELGSPPVSLGDAIMIAQKKYPDFSTSMVMMPEHSRDTYKLLGKGDYILFDDYSYKVDVNPWNGAIVNTFSPSSMGGLQTIMHIADPLHFGTIAGIWTKIIWFIFGLILTGMSIIGFLIWRLRLVKEKKENKTQQINNKEGIN